MNLTKKDHAQDNEPGVGEVLPFGRYGAGMLTVHPIGLVIVVGLLLIGLIGFSEARWFFGASLALGALLSVILWSKHR